MGFRMFCFYHYSKIIKNEKYINKATFPKSMINPMMYRVFLQDEKDAPSYEEKNTENHYRIRTCTILAWHYNCPPGWKPGLESQLKSAAPGSTVEPSDETIDGHILINYGGTIIGVVHDAKEIPEKTYQLAKREAQELAEYLSRKKGKPYQFIDATARGDKQLAKQLAEITHDEYVRGSFAKKMAFR